MIHELRAKNHLLMSALRSIIDHTGLDLPVQTRLHNIRVIATAAVAPEPDAWDKSLHETGGPPRSGD